MALVIENLQELKTLIDLVLEPEMWSIHTFDATVINCNGSTYDIQPLDPKLPKMTNLEMLGSADYVAITGSVVGCGFKDNGEAFIYGPKLTNKSSDFAVAGTSLQTWMTTTKATLDGHGHEYIVSGAKLIASTPTASVIAPVSAAPVTLPVIPLDLLSTTVKLKL